MGPLLSSPARLLSVTFSFTSASSTRSVFFAAPTPTPRHIQDMDLRVFLPLNPWLSFYQKLDATATAV